VAIGNIATRDEHIRGLWRLLQECASAGVGSADGRGTTG
jgi:hypothetical protein